MTDGYVRTLQLGWAKAAADALSVVAHASSGVGGTALAAANHVQPYCAGIRRELRTVFMPPMWDAPNLTQLEARLSYRAFYFNPATGAEHPAGTAVADAAGVWQPPVAPVFQDWVLVLERLSPRLVE